jgi:hypothetical protein
MIQPNEVAPAFQLLLDAARSLSATVDEAPDELTGRLLNSEILAGVDESVAVDRAVRDLPDKVVAVKLDQVPILIGELGTSLDPEEGRDRLRRFHNQAIIARSWLGMDAQNLQLFLVGPLGSATSDEWMDLAERFEADDRVCRKLVWLLEPDPVLESAVEFLGRTFVARPWVQLLQGSVQRLDRMDDIVLPPSWREIVEDDALDSDALVARIVEVTP